MLARDRDTPTVAIGVVGTGFVARHFVAELLRRPSYRLAGILTRRPPETITDLPFPEALTNSPDELIEASDVILECSGDVAWAAQTVERALQAGVPVTTLNPEFHVTVGSAFVGRGLLTELEGDQPGSQAALYGEAVAMGFKPLVLGNMKGFLNTNPTPEDMRYWAAKQGLSLPMVTSFTDGTKLQVEQCLVGNGLGAGIAREGLLGIATDDLDEGASQLAKAADDLGMPLTDYVLSRKLPHGVFVVCRHHEDQQAALQYFKMGPGPYYTLIRPHVLVHLEAFRTLERVISNGEVLLNNGARPRLSVAAVAKDDLAAGTRIGRGCGSFELRGICVEAARHPGHLPIGLADDIVLRRKVERDQILAFDDIDIEPSRAVDLWNAIHPAAETAVEEARS